MPFCCYCGKPTGDRDVYCAFCGKPQPAPPPRPMADPLAGISPRNAAMLCYIPIVGWIAAVVVLASNRFRHDSTVRFHAFQGLYLFVTWLIVRWVVAPFAGLYHWMPGPNIFELIAAAFMIAIICSWVFMMIKVAHNEDVKLPVLGDLAEKSVSEQR